MPSEYTDEIENSSSILGRHFSGSLLNRIGEGQFLIQKMDGEFFISRWQTVEFKLNARVV